MRVVSASRWCLVGAALCVAGCLKAPEPEFALDAKTKELLPKAESAVRTALLDNFGTPNNLVAWTKLPIDFGGNGPVGTVNDGPATRETFPAALPHRDGGWSIYSGMKLKFTSGNNLGTEAEIAAYDGATGTLKTKAALPHAPAPADAFEVVDPGWKLKDGRYLYMRHCLHCHGVAGDGAGPTAKYLNPRPRDYRLGIFKFTSTAGGIKANRSDLKRTLQEGIPGTSMPSFLLLSDLEQDLLVDYVRWLAMRGDYERRIDNELGAEYSLKTLTERSKGSDLKAALQQAQTDLDAYLKDEFPGILEDTAQIVVDDWTKAEEPESVVWPTVARTDPQADPESILRGRKLYMSEALKCYTCHGPGGKGDGTSTVDFWKIPNTTPEQTREKRGLHDDWGNHQQPRILTSGIYRGGRRPVDLYRRIFAGIKGTQMAGFATALKEDKDQDGNPLTPEASQAVIDKKIWDIVNYVLDVPYQPQTLPPLQATPAPATPPQQAAN